MDNILQYKDYYAAINFSGEDNVFYGKIIGINDLVSFEGESVAELTDAFYEAVEDYLETCKELGKQPDKTYKGTFNVRIPQDLHRRAALSASLRNISLNDFVKQSIEAALANDKSAITQNEIVLPTESRDGLYKIVPDGFKSEVYVTCKDENKTVALQHSQT